MTTPDTFRYSPDTAQWALDELNYTNIRRFYEEFTSSPHHLAGSEEGAAYAQNVSDLWRQFGLQKVEVEAVEVELPEPSGRIPSEVVIRDSEGNIVLRQELNGENSAEVRGGNWAGLSLSVTGMSTERKGFGAGQCKRDGSSK